MEAFDCTNPVSADEVRLSALRAAGRRPATLSQYRHSVDKLKHGGVIPASRR